MDEPQIIRTPAGEELVVLTRQEYDNLVNALAEAEEELADIATADQCKAEIAAKPTPYLPAEVTPLLFKYNNLVAAFRHWRGRSLADLAEAAAIEAATLARIEAREQVVTPEQATRLAAALHIPASWIEP
jgi:ribosome-binding protein aMBF1 (putative translation factor)